MTYYIISTPHLARELSVMALLRICLMHSTFKRLLYLYTFIDMFASSCISCSKLSICALHNVLYMCMGF